jgi:flavodoxin
MSKTLVAYFSATGNTKKLAEAIFDEVQGPKVLLPIEDVEEVDGYGLIFVGFPVHAHSVPYKAEVFLKRIPAGTKIAIFSTHGSLHGHRLSREAVEYAVVLASRAKVLGTYSSRGNMSLKALESLGRAPEHAEWTDMAPSASTHPDRHDIEEARNFARLIQAKARPQV